MAAQTAALTAEPMVDPTDLTTVERSVELWAATTAATKAGHSAESWVRSMGDSTAEWRAAQTVGRSADSMVADLAER